MGSRGSIGRRGARSERTQREDASTALGLVEAQQVAPVLHGAEIEPAAEGLLRHRAVLEPPLGEDGHLEPESPLGRPARSDLALQAYSRSCEPWVSSANGIASATAITRGRL